MSNPFYQSAPVSIPFSGNTDSNGNFTFSTVVRKAFWCTVKVVAEAPGNGHWSVKTLGGLPLDYAGGRACSMGPFLTPPADGITVTLTGALPNVAVTGHIQGKQHPDMSSAADAFNQSANPLSVEIASLTGSQFLVELSTAGTSSITFLLPPLIQNIICVGRIVGGASTVTVTGGASGKFLTLPLTTAGQVLIFPMAISTNFIQQIDYNSLGVTVAAFGNVTALDVYLQLGSMVSPANISNNPLFVQFPSTLNPLPWQAANNTAVISPRALAAGATASIVAAQATQKVYVFAMQVQVDEAAGGVAFEVFRIRSDGAGAKPFMAGDGAGSPQKWNHHGGGAPTPVGEGLQIINNDNIAHNFSVSVAFTQL